MAKWFAVEKDRAELRHAVVCSNVARRTKESVSLTCIITRIAEGYETVHWSTGVDQVFLHRGFSFIFPC